MQLLDTQNRDNENQPQEYIDDHIVRNDGNNCRRRYVVLCYESTSGDDMLKPLNIIRQHLSDVSWKKIKRKENESHVERQIWNYLHLSYTNH